MSKNIFRICFPVIFALHPGHFLLCFTARNKQGLQYTCPQFPAAIGLSVFFPMASKHIPHWGLLLELSSSTSFELRSIICKVADRAACCGPAMGPPTFVFLLTGTDRTGVFFTVHETISNSPSSLVKSTARDELGLLGTFLAGGDGS